MSEEQFQWWLAKDRIEPIGHEKQVLSLIAHSLLRFFGGEEFDADRAEAALMPWLKYVPKQDAQNEQARQLLNSVFGQMGGA